VVECEQSVVKQETAPTAVKAETEEESAASSVPRGVSAAGDEESSGEQHFERHQSENREAAALASVREEKNDNEELNNPFAAGDDDEEAAGGDDRLQPINDGTGDNGYGNPEMSATSIPASKMDRSKKRPRETVSSVERRGPRNGRLQTSSKKRAKLPHSTLHETSEEAGNTAQPRVVRRSVRRAATKAREGIFEGTSRGIEAEEEAYDDFKPVEPVEEDGSPVDDGDDDHDEDGNKSKVAERAQDDGSTHKSFDERFKALMDFKLKVGHCDVPGMKSGEYQSLGRWCYNLRVSYKKIHKNEKPNSKLTEENIRQLEDAGFKWNVSTSRSFDERYAELLKHKEKFGHCNVQRTKSGEYQSLAVWCNDLRTSYKKIQRRESPNYKLTQENIRQLEDAGFMWSLATRKMFGDWYAELMKYKEKFGHCNAPRTIYGENQSLGQWCSQLRASYKKIQNKETPNYNLTQENIQQLEDAGFKWSLSTVPVGHLMSDMQN